MFGGEWVSDWGPHGASDWERGDAPFRWEGSAAAALPTDDGRAGVVGQLPDMRDVAHGTMTADEVAAARQRGASGPCRLNLGDGQCSRMGCTYDPWRGTGECAAGADHTPAPPKRKARSVSQFTSFTRCGEAYRLEKVVKVPRAPAGWFAQGIAAHAAIEWYERSGREVPGDALREYALSEYDRLVQEDREREPNLAAWLTGGRVKAEDDLSRRRDRTAEMVAGYVRYSESAPERPLDLGGEEYAVEVPFSINLGGIEVIGYIDQIIEWPGGRLTPRDLKAGSKRPDWAIQLAVYDVAIAEMFDQPPGGWGDFYMLKDERPDRPVDLGNLPRPVLAEWFATLDEAINAGHFLPNPGDACRTCGVAAFCQAVGGRRAAEVAPGVAQ